MSGTASPRRLRTGWVMASALALTVLAAPIAWGQSSQSASIQGRVTDETGAALPGVTVTVTSRALQVPQLTATTDTSGLYRFIDLPLGTYRVTYELVGFQIFVRDELRLNAGFAAKLDAVLKVGALEETVTVSGEGPVIDLWLPESQTVHQSTHSDRCSERRARFQFVVGSAGADEQEAIGRRRDHEEIGRDDLADVISQERAPGLRGRLAPAPHVFRDGRLRDVDPEFQQFAMNPRRAPTRVRLHHPADQRADVRRHDRSPHAAPASRPTTAGSPVGARR